MVVEVPAQIVAWAQQADGEPTIQYALLALSYYESGWDEKALGDYTVDGITFYHRSQAPTGAWPTSFGLLQMHTPGGLGDGHSVEELLDGGSNFRLGAQYIRSRLGSGASLWDALSPWSARPTAWGLYERIQAEGIAGVSGPAPSPVPDGSPVGRANLAAAGVLIGGLLAVYWLLS